jgi:hypothetical protein
MSIMNVAEARERARLRELAIVARDAFPHDDWTNARHMSKASFAYVVSDNDAPHSDPTGVFCDAVTPDVLLALLDENERLRAALDRRIPAGLWDAENERADHAVAEVAILREELEAMSLNLKDTGELAKRYYDEAATLRQALEEIADQPMPGLARMVGYRSPEEIARAALAAGEASR